MTRNLLRWAGFLAIGIASTIPSRADDPQPERPMDVRESAKPIVRVAPRYPSSELRRRRQGWVQLNYVITEDGSIVDPVVEASSGSRAFEREALRTVKSWAYEPATWNGEPVQQCQTKVMLTFAIEGQQTSVGGNFHRSYRKASKAIETGDIDSARSQIDAMIAKENLTLSETSWLWALRARVAGLDGDRDAQLMALREATRGSGSWIDKDLLPNLLYVKSALELEKGQLSDGLGTYERLVKVAPDMPQIERLKPHVDRLQALVAGDSALSVPAEIGADGEDCESCAENWQYDPLRRRFSIANVNGSLGDIEFRCAWRRVIDKAEEGLTWDVPESFGDCSVIVFGDPGTTFDFMELPVA